MSHCDWDAIIVGAGPAGSALACRLGPQRRVLLLDRAPRSPLALPRIGESLPGAAAVLLQRCGGFERFLVAGHVERAATVSQWESSEPVWFDHLRDPNGPGWHLDRTRFDADLRAAAVAAGSTLIDVVGPLRVLRGAGSWRVECDAAVSEQRAPLLIDATGRNAVVARKLGIARRAEDRLTCLYLHLPADPGDEDQCTRVCVDRNGWWYSVRVPTGQRVLAFHLDADDAELRALRVPSHLLAKARRLPLLADVLPVATDEAVQVRPAGSAVLDRQAVARSAPGFFAVGDAGLAFDPIASQGIFHALASAESAANAIERSDDGGALDSRDAFLEEMDSVHVHYRDRLRLTYAAPAQYREWPFWARRIGNSS